MCPAPSSLGTSSLFFYWDQWLLHFCNPGCLLGRMIYAHCIKKKQHIVLKGFGLGLAGWQEAGCSQLGVEVRRQAPCEGYGRAPALAPQAQGCGTASASCGVWMRAVFLADL